MNKSILTNLVCAMGIIISFILGEPGHILFEGSLFGLSGAMTNWLAIHMLFEKVPGLYGSGIIPLKFNEFKKGIKELIMGQFFTSENINSSLGTSNESILSEQNKSLVFDGIVNSVMKSELGGMLAMFGGKVALESIRPHFYVELDSISNELKKKMVKNLVSIEHIEMVVDNKLSELTPEKVKEIIENMIKTHLGWLVVWGGVFGFLIGVFKSLFF
jgi:uncharacterized membrane protein YheB (UPF0754 family)